MCFKKSALWQSCGRDRFSTNRWQVCREPSMSTSCKPRQQRGSEMNTCLSLQTQSFHGGGRSVVKTLLVLLQLVLNRRGKLRLQPWTTISSTSSYTSFAKSIIRIFLHLYRGRLETGGSCMKTTLWELCDHGVEIHC